MRLCALATCGRPIHSMRGARSLYCSNMCCQEAMVLRKRAREQALDAPRPTSPTRPEAIDQAIERARASG